jgi:DNA-binding XRE family transcriptional regulator
MCLNPEFCKRLYGQLFVLYVALFVVRGNILTVYLRTVQEVQTGIAGRFKARRLAMNMTQRELATRSGVTWSSLKRFEREGLIALDSLLNLALVLDCLDDFDKLAKESQAIPAAQSLDALLATPALRRRATGGKGRRHGK